jgi:2-(1,2-epoxy-1,2-dihydrophenyl)acetyl-CoA isomerase
VLPRLIGQARALGLALTGQPLGAEQAEALGLIWRCVDDDKLAEETNALAVKFAAAPTAGLAAAKRLMRASGGLSLAAALDAERDAQRALGASADYREGVEAFSAKRTPNFIGR